MFVGPNAEIESFYSDNANELRDAAKSVKWCHTTNTPFASCTNGRVERRIRHVEEGTRTVLARARFPHRWWLHACKYFCHASNIRERDDESPSAWEARHGAPFGGMLIPFGAAVRFAPPTPLKKKLPKFGPNAVPGVFLGWNLHPGGRWTG